MREGKGGPARLSVGVVAGAHGVHGVLRVHLHDPASATLAPGLRVWLERAAAPAIARESAVERVDPVPGARGRLRVALLGVRDRDAALALRGCELSIEREAVPPLGEGEYWLADTIGLPVVRMREGAAQPLGTIVGLTTNGAQDLFEIEVARAHGRKLAWLLPVLPQFVIAVEPARVVVDPPRGMVPDELEEPES
jgi:16S rRNA processing protein RimM